MPIRERTLRKSTHSTEKLPGLPLTPDIQCIVALFAMHHLPQHGTVQLLQLEHTVARIALRFGIERGDVGVAKICGKSAPLN